MPASDDVDVQLRHAVAERGDVEFVTFGDGFERACGGGGFAEQLNLIRVRKVGEFDESRAGGAPE